MYDEKGVWRCQHFDDCFNCPFGDCIKSGIVLKRANKNAGKAHGAYQSTKPSYYKSGNVVYRY